LAFNDCLVTELDTPGSAVYANPGVVAMLNRTPGFNYQMYLGRLDSRESVNIAATDSSGGRSDLIVVRSENPISGTSWPAPSDPKSGPYLFTRVISDVDPNTTSYSDTGGGDSAYALARIDIPPSTATITQDMVVDLRQVANPLTGLGGGAEKEWTATITPESGQLVKSGSAGISFTTFPVNAVWSVPVPIWATEVDTLVLTNPYIVASSWGFARLQIAGSTPASAWVDYDEVPGQGGSRAAIMCAGTQTIPASVRGTTVPVNFQMRVSESASDGVGWSTGPGTPFYISLHFKQRPTS
jgi:hypothetical protein